MPCLVVHRSVLQRPCLKPELELRPCRHASVVGYLSVPGTRLFVDDVALHFETLLPAGQVPVARAIQREMHVGQRTAGRLRKQLTAQ